ncbi:MULTISPECIES: hypothetical protein [Pseudomonas]|uniref:Transcriptional regulator VspR n=1 Tax=Pseudomonas putida NBRC 14164 TaxID=1211579 RepID=A0ABM7E9D1_PSEPU|nr:MULTISPECIES: hypothetical protein [Pseudomonas]MCX9136034.1 hypothetical protein [Pseudomonas sp. DCB_PUT]MDD1971908.1 hypothetical protein [Pseudomonas putida]MDO1464125.1 hypothetical protein [Pseudomonas putida]MDO1469502.1 hypothetical protein [Pseudomonas putida]MDZ7325193.1 hypothetical protein [Pseudomonas sp. SDS3-8]
MKSPSFSLDRRIHELLQKAEFERFTPRSLRDAYASAYAVPRELASDLRRYIFRQLIRLQRVGWITRDPEKKGRDQVYHLANLPSSVSLLLVEEGYLSTAATNQLNNDMSKTCRDDVPDARTTQNLQGMVKEARLDFLTSMGEAERYKQLLDDMPHLQPKLENDYIEARDRSSRLLGHLRAMEKTLKKLGIG